MDLNKEMIVIYSISKPQNYLFTMTCVFIKSYIDGNELIKEAVLTVQGLFSVVTSVYRHQNNARGRHVPPEFPR